jgi:NAD dependent epimerase/dehydratase family enzyme
MPTRLPPQRVAVTGASGLIGTALVGHLRSEGHTVQRLVRRPAIARDEISWDPKAGTVDLSALEGVDAVIHLAGAGVGDKRWTKKYKSTILNSRLLGTTAIANAVATVKPSVFISGSAIGWYGEGAADLAGDVRTVKIRTGLVLDPTGGALGRMIPLFRFGLGGKLGNGKQWWSWITLHDQVRAICHLMESKISGPVNLTTPNPSTNQEFTAALARAMHRPALFPAPGFALKLALGGFSTEILGSKKILPQALLDDNFVFDYPHLTNALETLVVPH